MLTRIADGIWVHQSELLQNNTVVVQGHSGVLLVDPGITTTEMSCLTEDLRMLGQPVVAGFATHPDWDHALWFPELGSAPRYGTARCAAELDDLRSKPDWKSLVSEVVPPEIADDIPLDMLGPVTGLPDEATQIPWDGPAVRVIAHSAHSQGHAALVIEDRGVLIAGDMLSDVFIPMLDMDAADPIQDYLVGLQLLQEAAARVTIVVPGHGSIARGEEIGERIDADRAYVHDLRDGRAPSDARIGPDAKPGWEWVVYIHEGQRDRLAQINESAATVTRDDT